MYCHQCGRKLDASVCFCPDCGAKQNISTEEKNDSATVDRTTPVSSKDRDNTDILKKKPDISKLDLLSALPRWFSHS